MSIHTFDLDVKPVRPGKDCACTGMSCTRAARYKVTASRRIVGKAYATVSVERLCVDCLAIGVRDLATAFAQDVIAENVRRKGGAA